MIKVENIETWGFEHAIRGMRNPMNSWDKSDSGYMGDPFNEGRLDDFRIGTNDLDLMKRLYKAGTEHRKYARQIFVSMDITAPLYWWKEFDTYKVGTTSNSCSTMHKIHEKEFTLDDFSCEHISDEVYMSTSFDDYEFIDVLGITITALNVARNMYLKTKDKKYWWQMIQLLPSSYNQRRTVTMTYENVFSMIHQREHHKLDEWIEFTEILKGLPCVKEITENE